MERALSNTSTLIRFYRAKSFLHLLIQLFPQILVPSDCWVELQRKPVEPECVEMSRDLGASLVISEADDADIGLAGKLVFAMHDVGRGLDYPEALAIAMAHNRAIKFTLSEDGIARATPHRVELRTAVYNSLDLLAMTVERGLTSAKSSGEFLKLVRGFEEETRERVRERQLKKHLEKLFPHSRTCGGRYESADR